MKKLLFALISLLIGIGVTLAFLELFLRINPRFGYISSSYRLKSESLLKQLMQHKRYSPLLGFENIPNVDGISSYGLVSKEYKLKKDKDTFRILILGDSVGEGFDSGFLEDLLNENSFLHARYNFEVWNGSVGGYDIRRYYLYLKYKGLRYDPDMVIVFFCLNDFDIDTAVYYANERGAIQYYFFNSSELFKRYEPSPFLMRYSYLYRFIILRLNTYLLSIKEKICGINQRQEDGRYYLEKIKEICRKNNLPILAVIFPYLKPLSEYKDYQRQQYQDIKGVINSLGIDCLDLHEYLPQEDLYNLRIDKKDETHTKGKRCYPIVKIIYGYLVNKFFNKYDHND